MKKASSSGIVARAVARLVVALRFVIPLAWIAAAVGAWMFLPALGSGGQSPLGDIVPERSPAFDAQNLALERFGSVVATDTVLVQRNPEGLTRPEVEAHARAAREVAAGRIPGDLQGIRAAVPLLNTEGEGLPWRERNTTALTYLFIGEELNLLERDRALARYRDRYLQPGPGSTIGATGAATARLEQFEVIEDVLPYIEIATVAVILFIVALYFRSLGAPLVTLVTVAIAYVVAVRVLAWSGEQAGAAVPQEIEPILVVLLLGLVTDYTVFFLSENRRRLARGEGRVPAARAAAARIIPVVFTAGVIVACGCAALLAGELEFFRVFGPGLAVAAIVVTIVCITLVPALLALFGPWLFGRRVRHAEPPPAPQVPAAVAAMPAPEEQSIRRERLRRRFAGPLGAIRASRRQARLEGRSPGRLMAARLLAARPVSLLLVLVVVGGLGFAAAAVRTTDLGISFVSSLPEDTETRRAGDDAARGFVDGILSPTDVIIEQDGIGTRPDRLVALQEAIVREPGVAAALGPRELAQTPIARFAVARDGGAARIVVVLDGDPTGAPGIDAFERLEARMPALAREAGLDPGLRISYAGETALASDTIAAVVEDLKRIAVVTLVVTFILLAIFLRALIAPLLLLLASVLAFVAALGVTALVVPEWFGVSQLTYYVPLVGAVLLIALGSDYNVFIAGRIRDEARKRRLREAIAVAAPAASRAITVAGITLAATFALLAIVPLRPFRELALLMTVGVLLDALVVRPVLIPALISVVGRASWWPGRAITPPPARDFLERVADRRDIALADARTVTDATLRTLGERLSQRQAHELAAQLPDELSGSLTEATGGEEPFSYDEFLTRVADRQGTSLATARDDAAAVMATVAEAVSESEIDYVRAGLSEDYRALLGDRRTPEPAPPPVEARG